MAGYMQILTNYVYKSNASNGAGVDLENGMIVVLDTANNGKFKLPAADATVNFLCQEKTDLFDGEVAEAYRFVFNGGTSGIQYYFIENNLEPDDTTDYKYWEMKIPQDTATRVYRLRAHPLQSGDEFITNKVTGTITVGATYGVLATGCIG